VAKVGANDCLLADHNAERIKWRLGCFLTIPTL